MAMLRSYARESFLDGSACLFPPRINRLKISNMTNDANTLSPEPAAEVGILPDREPAFLVRAQRILDGDIRPEDYLPVPNEIESANAAEVTRLREVMHFEVSEEFIAQQRNNWTLQFIHGAQLIACRETRFGVIVFAVGTEQIRLLVERFIRPEHRSGFFITVPPPWQTPTPMDSLNHSPLPLSHSGQAPLHL